MMRNCVHSLASIAALLSLSACSTGGIPGSVPMQATFSDTSEKPPQELAQCIATELGEDAKVGFEDGAYIVWRPRGVGALRYRVIEKIEGDGSIVEYDSELGRGAELDKIRNCT
ncbi:hypothetical protein K3163_03550 [Qipengyuania sp. 1NDW9]|uniref:hypothetical protein n=1 Tax=Qipengyuania xiapuensis TaxID=2867236 RepID=UPI001C873C6F|nr:hypothetical protein [Qipengyuania xiapuensis]MBX7492279.1 hypothetical protein [Qipengyuania xiapuensis]